MALRVIFMGTPEFAIPALEALIESRHQVIAAFTRPPKPAGRGMDFRLSPVQKLAEKNHIPVFTPATFRNPSEIGKFKALKADLAVVAAYGLLLPEAVLSAPRLGCINIHASLLPRWRGAAPIQYAILKGDEKSGISIMQMEKGLDTGPLLAAKSLPLKKDETAGTLHDRLARLGGEMIVPVLEQIEAGKASPQPQDDEKATYAPKIKKSEAQIDWHKPVVEIERMVRAFNPFPGAFFMLDKARIRVLEGKIETAKGKPGEVLDKALLVATGTGAYRIEKLQKAGGKPLPAEDFLRGYKIPQGTVLGA